MVPPCSCSRRGRARAAYIRENLKAACERMHVYSMNRDRIIPKEELQERAQLIRIHEANCQLDHPTVDELNFRIAIANANVPNMVSQISSVLAAAGLNIHNMVNKSKGDMAYTLVDVDSAVTIGMFPWRFVDGESCISRCVAIVDDAEYESLMAKKAAMQKTKYGDAFESTHVESINKLSQVNLA